jgi:putative membrane protein insertion efficiency factor
MSFLNYQPAVNLRLKMLHLINHIIKLVFITIIKIYQWVISPLLGCNCRFYPSCSSYAQEAIDKWGLRRGMVLAIKRLLRCHPLSKKHGYDPVPTRQHDT